MGIKILKNVIILLTVLCVTNAYGQRVVRGTSSTVKTTFKPLVPKPVAPPKLDITGIHFSDKDNNNLINADELCLIRFVISNSGEGSAYQVKLQVEEMNGIQGLVVDNAKTIQELKPGDTDTLTFGLNAEHGIVSGQALLAISASEGNGFDAEVQNLKIATREFETPQPVVADAKFSTKNGGNKVSFGEVVTLQVLVQNQGQGLANDVKLNFALPSENVFAAGAQDIMVGVLAPGEQKVYEFPFMVNSRYESDSVRITTRLSESYGIYGETKEQTLSLSRPVSKAATIEIVGNDKETVITAASLHSDVDINIPENRGARDNVFALVIGNENYAENRGLQKELDVPFAGNDALVFAEYLKKTLGIPENNIRLIVNATKAQMDAEINLICKLADTYGKGPAEIIFYYAGHGLCDEDKQSYLVPVDITGAQVKRGVRVDRMYRKFGALTGVRTTVFVDACFSGGARAGTLVAARGIRVEPDKNAVTGNIVVFSAASGNQTAHPYTEKQHGMFTYYLLKNLQQTGGNVSCGELADYLKTEVTHNALKINNTTQVPETQCGYEVKDTWEKWTLR